MDKMRWRYGDTNPVAAARMPRNQRPVFGEYGPPDQAFASMPILDPHN